MSECVCPRVESLPALLRKALQAGNHKCPFIHFIVSPRGIEPLSQASEACALSIGLWGRGQKFYDRSKKCMVSSAGISLDETFVVTKVCLGTAS